MAWELLRTDYVDAVFEGVRRYLVKENGDGTVSFHDVTDYAVKEEAFFGAKDVNRINTAVNAILAALENDTDLYEAFTLFFEAQKELFLQESDAKQEDFEVYIVNLRQYMDGKWDELKAEYTGNIQHFEDVQENAFNGWFQMVRDQLGTDPAGHLQNQIGNLNNLQSKEKGNLVAAVNSLRLSYDETYMILGGVKTVNVTLSAADGANVEGQTVTLVNSATGVEITQNYEEGGISFEVIGYTEYSLIANAMENHVTPKPMTILISEEESRVVDLEYKLNQLNDLPWEKIIEVSESGNASTIFSLHDEKEIELTTGEKVVVEIVGFDHDILTSDDSKTAGITFGMKYCLEESFRMNNTNGGSWEDSEMRTITIRECLYDVLPEDLKDGIKVVNKTTSKRSSFTVETTEDDVWLFSLVELGIAELVEPYIQEGTAYPVFTDNRARMRKNALGINVSYFTRSQGGAVEGMFYTIDISGKSDSAYAASTNYMIAGFCV